MVTPRRIIIGLMSILTIAAALWLVGSHSEYGTWTVQRRRVVDEVYGVGEIRARRMIDVYPEVAGRVRAVYVREGDVIQAGDLLIEIDDRLVRSQLREAEAALAVARARLRALIRGARPEERSRARAEMEAARAALVLAEAEWRRAEELWRAGVLSHQILDERRTRYEQARYRWVAARAWWEQLERGPTQEERDQAQAAVVQAEARVETLRQYLEKTRIRAPWDGVVLRVGVREGDVVHPEIPRPLLRIADMSRYVEAEVDYTDAFRVKEGQSAIFYPENFPEYAKRGKITLIYGEFGKKTLRPEDPRAMVDRKVRRLCIEPEGPLDWAVGLTVEVRIRTFEGEGLAIPREWVIVEEGRYWVWRETDRGVIPTLIEPAYVGIRWIVVRRGLREGDRLVFPKRI